MVYNSRSIALIISLIVASLTTIFLSLINDVQIYVYIVAFSISLGSSFLLTYFALQFFIFREIEKLKRNFESFKKKEIKLAKRKRNSSTNPLALLGRDMEEYAYAKQLEIEQLKKEGEFRRDFLADVAHELKTPIFAAQGFIHTLLDGAIDDKEISLRFLKKSAKSIDGLENLVKDLIVISQMESGDVKLNIEYFNFVLLTQEVIEQLEHKAGKRGTTIVFNKNTDDDILVKGDIQRLRQVMTNFIDNAIKYGKDDGEIVVDLTSSKKKLTVSISDDGPGISEEHQARIFERFYRVDKSRSRDTGGTGLGLAIVKHILEAHKTKIDIESEVNKGTKFTFTLKLIGSEED